MALTELSWLTDTPPAESAAFLREVYPSVGTVASNAAAAEAAGLRVLDTFSLPPSAWWDDYYTPLRARAEALREAAAQDPELSRVIEETEREIAVFERDPRSYGYVFYLLQGM
jgi:serine/threonine-protein kinase HipA